MASKEDLTDQLGLTQKLTAAVDQMARSMSRVETSYSSQVDAVTKLSQAIETLKGQDLSSLNNTKLDGLQASMKQGATGVTTLTGKMKDLGNTMSKKFPSSVVVGVEALAGLEQGVRNLIAMSKGIGGFFASFVSGAASIAASIIAIPFKMFAGLVSMAADASGGSNELAQAIENLRKEMGDLKGPGTSAVLEASKSLKGFSDTGLNAYRVFGTLAQRIEMFTKTAVAMGATFGILTKEFADNGGALVAFQKGLGISDEQMKSLGDRAITVGDSMGKVFMDITKQTLSLGKAFGLDQKLIGKDLGKAIQDVHHFGAVTIKEMGQASVYARKLGIELDKIVGTLDAFETFDSAAENAAKLSQAFGVQVDAFKLMEAQNPAEQMELLRKSFKDAGVDASQFTRQQAKLLSTTTGLDEATVRQAFSMKNQGVGLDDIKKKSEAASKKTMSQADAMAKLADSIERMVQSGSGQQAHGFFDMFVKGFLGGVQSSQEFRTIIMSIKRALQQTYMEGVRLGRAFVQMFPGVKQFLGGIADFFQPAKFKSLIGGVTDIFIGFFKDLTTGRFSFPELMKQLQKKFFDFFSREAPAGKKMLDGFKTVFTTLSKVVAEGVKWIADKLAESLRFVTELIKDPSKLADGLSAGKGGLGFIGSLLLPMVDALGHAWKVIAPAAIDLLKIVGGKIFDFLKSEQFAGILGKAGPIIAAIVFGPSFTRAVMGGLLAQLGKAAIGALTGGSAETKILKKIAEQASNVASKSSALAGKAGDLKGIETAGNINASAGKAIKSGGSWGVQDAVKLGLKLVALAVALGIGGVAISIALVEMKKILETGGIKTLSDAVVPLTVLGAMVLATLPLTLAMKLASKTGSITEVLKGGLIIVAAVAAVGLVGAGIAYMMKQVGNPAELTAAGDIMVKMSLVFLAMVPLILAAGVIGAIASATGGVALAAAGIGLAAIGVAIGEMVTISMVIIKQLSAMEIAPDFQVKINAFLSVMKAIQTFADTLLGVISAMQPSFTELLTGTAVSFPKKAEAATDLLQQMVGSKGSNKGIVGLVETVIDMVKGISSSPQIAQSAKIFSEILMAVSEALKSLTPPDAFFEAGSSFINKLVDPTYNFANMTQDIATYAKTMREGAMMMLTGDANGSGKDGVLGIIDKLASIRIPDPNAASIVSTMLSAIAGVLKAISPSPETLKAFANTKEVSAYWGLVKTSTSELDTKGMGETMTLIGSQFTDLIEPLINGVLSTVIEKASGLGKTSLDGVKALGDVLNVVSTLMQVASEAAKNAPSGLTAGIAARLGASTDQIPSISVMLNGMKNSIGPLINNLTAVVNSVPTDKDFMKKLDVAKTLFAFIAEIPKLASSLQSVQGPDSNDIKNIQPLIDAIGAYNTFLIQLVNDPKTGGHPLEQLIANIDMIGKMGLASSGNKMSQTAEGMGKLFSSVGNTAKSLTEMVSSAMSATALINTGGIAMAITAVSDMVKAANDLNTALNDGDLNKINVTSKLSNVARAVGLGSKANYTIKNKDVVITLNLNVSMDVDKVEKIMVLRKTSIIRNRLEYGTVGDGAAKPGSPSLPESYSDAPVPDIQAK